MERSRSKKKPAKRVLSIEGAFQRDVVTDDDLELVADKQAQAWRVEQEMQQAVARLKARLEHGATVKATRYYFDRELGMVRTESRARRRKGDEQA